MRYTSNRQYREMVDREYEDNRRLRQENKILKDRIEELEAEMENAVNLISDLTREKEEIEEKYNAR